MSQTKKDDLYKKWLAEGVLQEKLDLISMLVKANVGEIYICEYLEIKLKDYRELRQKYKDFDFANDPENPRILVKCLATLEKIANGYFKTNTRKLVYQNKKGVDKATFEESTTWYQPNPSALFYFLEKMQGSKWSPSAETLELQKKKYESQKEEWK